MSGKLLADEEFECDVVGIFHTESHPVGHLNEPSVQNAVEVEVLGPGVEFITGINGESEMIQAGSERGECFRRPASGREPEHELVELSTRIEIADGDGEVVDFVRASRQILTDINLIVRALLLDPPLLLLDEPSTGLDVAACEQLLFTIDDLHQAQPQLATILVTHHLEELPETATHAMLIKDGRVHAVGCASDVLTTRLATENASPTPSRSSSGLTAGTRALYGHEADSQEATGFRVNPSTTYAQSPDHGRIQEEK